MKLKTGYIFSVMLTMILQFSCNPEEEIISENPDYQLVFSSDTIAFDTVFTSIGSVTKRLMVRNPNPNALIIETISVGGGEDSPYRISIGGTESNGIENLYVLGKDSLLVLVSVTVDPNDETLPFVVRDSIVFMTNGNVQDVKLQSWGQNANFIGNVILSCGTNWTADLPYFVHGSILVDTLCTLNVLEGVQVYASFNSFIFIKGTLNVQGSPGERVVFRNERLEARYENVPGQWGGIIFLEGSKNNVIEYADIRNVQYGVRLGTPDNDSIPDLVLKHVRIENTAVAGIAAFTSDLWAENTLINTSAGYVAGNFAGGNYTYNHCTFANYPILFFGNPSMLIITDAVDLEDGTTITEAIHVNLLNTIVWGYKTEEIALELTLNDESEIFTHNSILKTSLEEFEGPGTILSTKDDFMLFRDVDGYDYTPDSLSPAIDNALGSETGIDLFGQPRDSLPDIGAIEYKWIE